MGFFSDIGSAFKSIGEKTLQGAGYLLDKGIQGAKYITDKADEYTLGLDHFIPYYSAIKAGIDISDHLRKMAKGEESLSWSSALDMGLDVGVGALSAYGGKAELEGLKGGYKMFKGARATGSGMKEAIKMGGSRALRGYGLHKEQLKQMGSEGFKGALNVAKAVRKGDPVAIAKVGVGVGIGVGGAEVYRKSQQEDSRRSIVPPPNQTPRQRPPRQPTPQIHTKPIKPMPIKYTSTGIYQNGRLVG